jgi:hypothetical protein
MRDLLFSHCIFLFSKRIGPNQEKKIVNFKAPDITTPPHWTGMEEELSSRFKVVFNELFSQRFSSTYSLSLSQTNKQTKSFLNQSGLVSNSDQSSLVGITMPN